MTTPTTRSGAPDPSVSVVHVVSKTHCDLGFTDLASTVARRYVEELFPRAVAVSAELRDRGGPERLVWTTGSLVLQWALEDPDGQRRAAVLAAVERGDLAWHAIPATTHTELMDAQLVRSGLGIGAALDRRFRAGATTTAAKLTDVPGHTRGLVPLLAEAGVVFLHIGVNPAWPVPDVPPLFRWRSPDGSELVVAYQAGGYGGTVRMPGSGEVLSFLHADDNLGPPTADEVVANHAALRIRYPEAEIRASTLDAFTRSTATPEAVDALPVVTAEIGDPWLFGAGSDPLKVSAHRDLMRARIVAGRHHRGSGSVSGSTYTSAGAGTGVDRPKLSVVEGGSSGSGAVPIDPLTAPEVGRPPEAIDPLDAVDRWLFLVAEHTWGLDQKTWLPDTTRWNRAGLAELRATPEGARFESSWAEQRAYVDEAAESLRVAGERSTHASAAMGRPPTVDPLAARAAQIGDQPIGAAGAPVAGGVTFDPVYPGSMIDGGSWLVEVDPVDGSLRHLEAPALGRVLADDRNRLGLLRYQSFDAADYERFYAQLTPTAEDEWWARWDNTKPGIDAVPESRSGYWAPDRSQAWHATGADGEWHDLRVEVRFADDLANELGAPPTAWIRWFWTTDPEPDGEHHIEVTTWWVDKPANRLPEALWLSFAPKVSEPTGWTMDKLGQPVSPLDVVRHGGRALHGVGEGGLTYDGPEGAVRLRTVDAPLVAPGEPRLLDADPPVPDMAGGWHVLLADNCWGTNFPMWIEGPAGYRFDLTVD